MAKFTVTILGVCTGSGHVRVRLNSADGRSATTVVETLDLRNAIDFAEIGQVLPTLLRGAVLEQEIANPTAAQIKAAVEAKTYYI